MFLDPFKTEKQGNLEAKVIGLGYIMFQCWHIQVIIGTGAENPKPHRKASHLRFQTSLISLSFWSVQVFSVFKKWRTKCVLIFCKFVNSKRKLTASLVFVCGFGLNRIKLKKRKRRKKNRRNLWDHTLLRSCMAFVSAYNFIQIWGSSKVALFGGGMWWHFWIVLFDRQLFSNLNPLNDDSNPPKATRRSCSRK